MCIMCFYCSTSVETIRWKEEGGGGGGGGGGEGERERLEVREQRERERDSLLKQQLYHCSLCV